jgi:hypothetical protein
VCWGAPKEADLPIDYTYFCASPTQFREKHLPKDSEWQLSKRPIGLKEFCARPMIGNSYFEQRFEGFAPVCATLEAGIPLKISLANAFPTELDLQVTLKDEKGDDTDLPFTLKTLENGVTLSFTIPASAIGELHIYSLGKNDCYYSILYYGIQGPKPSSDVAGI